MHSSKRLRKLIVVMHTYRSRPWNSILGWNCSGRWSIFFRTCKYLQNSFEVHKNINAHLPSCSSENYVDLTNIWIITLIGDVSLTYFGADKPDPRLTENLRNRFERRRFVLAQKRGELITSIKYSCVYIWSLIYSTWVIFGCFNLEVKIHCI